MKTFEEWLVESHGNKQQNIVLQDPGQYKKAYAILNRLKHLTRRDDKYNGATFEFETWGSGFTIVLFDDHSLDMDETLDWISKAFDEAGIKFTTPGNRQREPYDPHDDPTGQDLDRHFGHPSPDLRRPEY